MKLNIWTGSIHGILSMAIGLPIVLSNPQFDGVAGLVVGVLSLALAIASTELYSIFRKDKEVT